MDFEKEMAMFRYAVITPLLHGNDERSLKKECVSRPQKSGPCRMGVCGSFPVVP